MPDTAAIAREKKSETTTSSLRSDSATGDQRIPLPLGANIPPLYFIEVDYGRHGRAFVETDRDSNSRASIIKDILDGQYDRGSIVTILEVFEDEGTVRNVTEDIANEVLQEIYRRGDRHQCGATDFVDRHGTKSEALEDA